MDSRFRDYFDSPVQNVPGTPCIFPPRRSFYLSPAPAVVPQFEGGGHTPIQHSPFWTLATPTVPRTPWTPANRYLNLDFLLPGAAAARTPLVRTSPTTEQVVPVTPAPVSCAEAACDPASTPAPNEAEGNPPGTPCPTPQGSHYPLGTPCITPQGARCHPASPFDTGLQLFSPSPLGVVRYAPYSVPCRGALREGGVISEQGFTGGDLLDMIEEQDSQPYDVVITDDI